MITVNCTKQEKKKLAVIYGFLVNVWAAENVKPENARKQTQMAARKIQAFKS